MTFVRYEASCEHAGNDITYFRIISFQRHRLLSEAVLFSIILMAVIAGLQCRRCFHVDYFRLRAITAFCSMGFGTATMHFSASDLRYNLSIKNHY